MESAPSSPMMAPAACPAGPLTLDDRLVLYAHHELAPDAAVAFEAEMLLQPELEEGLARYCEQATIASAATMLCPSDRAMAQLWQQMRDRFDLYALPS